MYRSACRNIQHTLSSSNHRSLQKAGVIGSRHSAPTFAIGPLASMGSLLSLFQLTAKVDNRLMVEVVNTTSISAHVWINGGGPLVAALPPGERTTIAVPSHIKAGLKRAKWQATASTYNSISIARGTVSFDPSGGPPSITITTCGVPLRTLIYLVGVQRVWRARTAAAVAQRKRLVAQRKRSAAVNLQRAARGFLARCRVQCFICLDEMPPAAMVRTSRSCRDHRHRVCGPCAAMYVDHEVGEARFYIPCPGAGERAPGHGSHAS